MDKDFIEAVELIAKTTTTIETQGVRRDDRYDHLIYVAREILVREKRVDNK